MIQFLIRGKELEMPDGFSVSFTFNNSLFGFDSLQLSRTTAFEVPHTPVNDLLLGLSHLPQVYGRKMRKLYDCEMRYSGGFIWGQFAILSHEKNGYACIFMFGDMSSLIGLRETKLKNLYNITDSIFWGDTTPITPARTIPRPNVAIVDYFNGLDRSVLRNGINLLPSVKLSYLLNKVPIDFQPDYGFDADRLDFVDRLFIKLGGAKVSTPINGSIHTPTNQQVGIVVAPAIAPYFESIRVCLVPNLLYTYAIRAKKPCSFRVGSDFAYDVCMWKGHIYNSYQMPTDSYVSKVEIIKNDVIKYHDNPSGKSPYQNRIDGLIELQKDDFFCFMRAEYLTFGTGPEGTTITNPKFDTWYSKSLLVSSEGEKLDYNEPYSIIENLPALSCMDLIKTVAAITNTSVDLSFVGGIYEQKIAYISFFDMDFTNIAPSINADDRLIGQKTLTRKYLDFSQHNIIDFDSSSSIQENLRIKEDYVIDNENLPKSKILQTIPFSEAVSNGQRNVYDIIRNDDGEYEIDDDSNYLLYANDSSDKLDGAKFFAYRDDCPFRSLIYSSTTVVIDIHMYLFEFLNIKNKTLVMYQGIKYAISAANFSKNVATLTLIKVQ